MGDVLAIAEQRDGQLRGVSKEVVSAAARVAAELGGSAHALLVGGPGVSVVAGTLSRYGAVRVQVAEHETLARYSGEAHAPVVGKAIRRGAYSAVLLVATAQGKDLAPRVAASLDVPLAPDATELEVVDGALVVVRPVYSGKAFARVSFSGEPGLVSIRPNVFPPLERPVDGSVDRLEPKVDALSFRTRLREFNAAESGAVDVATATVVVSGGRGMKDPGNWPLLEDLRDALGPATALGASRAVVDAGWRPHGEQVGQTGKTVSPKLYFAIGISGAIQHLAGMRTSQTIVAVNKDPDAPIFGVANYGIVGDLFEVVPRLAEEIRALKASA